MGRRPPSTYLPPKSLVGLSLHQSSLDLSLRAPRVRKQKLPAFLKWLQEQNITSTSSLLLPEAQVSPRFKGWKSRFPLFVEMDRHQGRRDWWQPSVEAGELLLGPEGKKEDQSAAAAVRDCHQSFLVFLPLKISLSTWKTYVIVLVSCTLGWCVLCTVALSRTF